MSKVDAAFIERLVAEKFAPVVATLRRTRGNEEFVAMDYVELAAQVGKQLGRDRAAKERIVSRSPFAFSGLDAAEFAGASAAELAKRELAALGIKPDGRSVEEQLLDAHHAGRDFARRGGRTGSMDGTTSIVDKYLQE